MKLVSAKKMVEDGLKGGYAVPHFNVYNLESMLAVVQTCQKLRSPVIVGYSENACKHWGGGNVVAAALAEIVKSLAIDVPVALHLDHGSFEAAKKALEWGFTSVMFDGSKLKIEENAAKCAELVALAKAKNASVEGEVGSIGGEEDGVIGAGELADPAECARLVKAGIDFLAAGIGNIHGAYPPEWKGIDLPRLRQIKEKAGNVPLVLHGGTGIPDAMVKEAIAAGVAKINVGSEIQWVFTEAVEKYIADGKAVGKGRDPRKLVGAAMAAIAEVVERKTKLFGSVGKA